MGIKEQLEERGLQNKNKRTRSHQNQAQKTDTPKQRYSPHSCMGACKDATGSDIKIREENLMKQTDLAETQIAQAGECLTPW